jgi:hypothetical protein
MIVLPRSRRSTPKSHVPQAGPPRRRSGAAAADDGIVGMDLRPGRAEQGRRVADGKPLVHVLPTGDIQISEKMMAEERGIIDDVFLVSLFKVLSEHPNMTATQVIELVNEKGMLVAPTLGRQHTEYVGGWSSASSTCWPRWACSTRCRRGCARRWAPTR